MQITRDKKWRTRKKQYIICIALVANQFHIDIVNAKIVVYANNPNIFTFLVDLCYISIINNVRLMIPLVRVYIFDILYE